MPPRHALRCLGVPELRGPTGEPIRFRTRKHLALLIYLAVEPRRRHRRDRLADLLWPDASPAEGRHSISTALSVIRGKVGIRTFETTRDTVRLITPDLEVDLERLARGDILGDDVTPPLDIGGFLDEFDIGKAPEFGVWCDQQRAKWFPSIREAFVILMDRCRRTGNQVRIEPLADRLLALDELSEEAIRAKMEARAFAGDRLTALRVFQEWRKRLAEEVGATPSPLVEGMALRLRQRGYEPPGTSHIPTVATDQWRNRAFIGRGRQYQVVYELWEETNRGHGRHALLLGDSGIGKTTLTERLVTAAGLEGAVSSRVQCYDAEREIPFTAIGTLVRGLLEHPGASATPPEWLAAVGRVVPAVRERYPHLPPPLQSEGETARHQLTEGIHQLINAIADENPVILVVDDAHLADDASIAVLHLLLRRLQASRVMILLAARESELKLCARAGQLLEHRDSLGVTAVEVPPLTPEETGEVVRALATAENVTVIPAVRRALVRAAAGIPMVLELLFDDWRIHGEQSLALSVDAMTSDSQADAGQEMYHRLLDRVFRDLPEAARAVLHLAAILGERLNDLPMYQLVDLTLAQTLAGMSELTQRRILRDGGREMEFRNELLRSYAYMQVPSPLRRALHGLIADRLIEAEVRGESVPGLMLAWHCFRSLRPLEAIPYLLRGAREAMDGGAPYDAEFALKTAMASLGDDVKPVAKLLLAEALQEQGRWEESIEVVDSQLVFDERQKVRSEILRLNASSAQVKEHSLALANLRQSEELLSSGTECEDAAELLWVGQRAAYFLADREAALRLIGLSAIAGARQLRVRDDVKWTAASIALHWLCGRTAQYDAVLGRSRAVIENARNERLSGRWPAQLLHSKGCLELSSGGYAESIKSLTAAHEAFGRLLDEEMEATSAGNIALVHSRLGNYAESRDWALRSLKLHTPRLGTWAYTTSVLRLALSHAMLGAESKALELVETPLISSLPDRSWQAQAAGLLSADIYFLCNERRTAVNLARSTLDATGYLPLSPAYVGIGARWMLWLCNENGNWDAVSALLAEKAGSLGALDLIDQAEVMSCCTWMSARGRMPHLVDQDRLRRTLTRLPEAVSRDLARQGLPTF